MTTPDFKTVDLGSVLSGQAYPEEIVPIYFDHVLGHELSKAAKELERAELLGVDVQGATERYEKARAALKDVEWKATIRAVPRALRLSMEQDIAAKFPDKKDMLGRSEPNLEREEEFANRFWALHVIRIVGPDGETSISNLDDPNTMKYLRGNAPSYTVRKVEEVIQGLYADSSKGFEQAVQETDFLSDASPEA